MIQRFVASLGVFVALCGFAFAGTAQAADNDRSCTVKAGDTLCVVDLGGGDHQNCTLSVSAVDALCTLPDESTRPCPPGQRYDSRIDRCVDFRDRDCPVDQARDNDGHCVPRAIISRDRDGNRCVTFLDQTGSFGRSYNDNRDRLLRQAQRSDSDGGTTITRAEQDRIFNDSDLVRYRDSWNRAAHDLTTECPGQKPQVVINNNVTPASTSPGPTVVTPAPAPSSGGGQVSQVPSGGAETGDGSTVADDEQRELDLAVGFGGLALLLAGVSGLAWHYWTTRAR